MITFDNHLFAKTLRMRRKRLKLPEYLLARSFGVTQGTLSRYENGHCPDVLALVRILHWLDMPVEFFVLDEGVSTAERHKPLYRRRGVACTVPAPKAAVITPGPAIV